jgi:MoxR-like ATPase
MNAARYVATIPIPLPQDVLDRADALAAKAEQFPEFALARMSRTGLLRLAILRGLDVLEQEAKRKR